MMTSREVRTPFWTVTAVFDPDGHGGDFAYTVGLAERGLPELHLWARPALGPDPGADWKFSNRDMGGLLNAWAWRLIDGDLSLGDTWSEEFDAGFTTVTFQLDPPQDADSLEAFEAAGSPVAPVRWALQRPAVGPPVPMTAQACQAAAQDLDWVREAATRIGALEIVMPEPRWRLEAEFGPRTPVVEGFAQVLQALSGDDVEALIVHVIDLQVARAATHPLVAARSAARSVGRLEHIGRAEALAEQIGQGFGMTWGRDMVEGILARFGAVERHDREMTLVNLRDVLAETLASFFATVVVADQLDTEQRVAGLGPVMTALSEPAAAPTPEWWAPQAARQVLASVVQQSAPEDLVGSAVAWYGAAFELSEGWSSILRARAMSSAAMAPNVADLMTAPAALRMRQICQVNHVPWSCVQQWARDLCALQTFGEQIPDHVAQAFAQACVPQITAILTATR